METLRTIRVAPLFLMIIVGCGSSSGRGGSSAHPPMEPSPENPVVFNLDMSTPLPLVSLLATPEEAARLRARYSSFFVEMGPSGKGGTLSLRFDRKGSLGIPWNF